jgi:hypothetical protein
MWIEIGLAIAVPGTAAAIGVIRYFWKKEKCFIAMRNKIDELSRSDGDSDETHTDFDYRMKVIETNQQKWIIYLKLLLKDRNIPYDE